MKQKARSTGGDAAERTLEAATAAGRMEARDSDTAGKGSSRERFTPFRERRAAFLELWEHRSWRMKLYGISITGDPPRPALICNARQIAARTLGQGPSGYGLGWIIVHEGQAGDYVLVDWWTDQDLVQHRLHGAPRGAPSLQYGWPQGAGFCVWELAVCWFERQAWVRHVLARAADPHFEGYLRDRLDGWV